MPRVIYANREMIITAFVVSACLGLASFFPAQGVSQNLSALSAFLVVVPLLYLKLVLKQDLSGFGVQAGDWKKGMFGAAASLVVALLLVYVLLNYTGFLKTQAFVGNLKNDFGGFLSYEILSMGALLAVFEFFFRGFVMGSIIPKLGRWSMAAQFFIFLIFLALTGGFGLGMAYFVISAFFAGWIFYQSRSLIYSFVFSWIFFAVADAIVIRLS
jgi:hypothetical protein